MWSGRTAIDASPSSLLKVLGGSFVVTVELTVDGHTRHAEFEGSNGKTVQVVTTDGQVQAWVLA